MDKDGETVVHFMGHDLGGRNQEIARSAADEIDGLTDTAIFSVGSDGTDGPTGTNVNDLSVILIRR